MSSNTSYAIRDATAEDVSAANELINLVIAENVLPQEVPQDAKQTLAMFTCLQAHGYPCLVASVADKVIACAAFTPIEEPIEGYGCEFNCDLLLLVHPKYRQQQLGTRLFSALLQHEKTLSLRLYVATGIIFGINEPARRWLLKNEWYHSGSLPGIAEKEGRPMDSEYYSKTLSGAPSVLGMGFPSTEHGKPCAKRRFRLPVNQDQLVIRPAEWKDLPDMVAIFNRAILYSKAHSFSVPLLIANRVPWFRQLLENDLPCFVAVLEGQVVGWMVLGDHDSAPAFKRTLEISAYLRPEVTRQRIGKQLFDACTAHPTIKRRNIKQIVACVTHDNAIGMGSAIKLGFSFTISSTHKFYKFGEHRSTSRGVYIQPQNRTQRHEE